jgi:hypothetical protein
MKNLDKLVTFFISLNIAWKIDEFNHVIVWKDEDENNWVQEDLDYRCYKNTKLMKEVLKIIEVDYKDEYLFDLDEKSQKRQKEFRGEKQ